MFFGGERAPKKFHLAKSFGVNARNTLESTMYSYLRKDLGGGRDVSQHCVACVPPDRSFANFRQQIGPNTDLGIISSRRITMQWAKSNLQSGNRTKSHVPNLTFGANDLKRMVYAKCVWIKFCAD